MKSKHILLSLFFLTGILLWHQRQVFAQAGVGTLNIISSSQTNTGDLTSPRLLDVANSLYYLDPAGTTSLVTAGDATLAGKLTVGNGQTIRSTFGPLTLEYKSALNTWATGITLQDTTGKVGIGTTSPTAVLAITGNSTSPALTVTQNSTGNIVNFADATDSVFTIEHGGNLTLGDTSQSAGAWAISDDGAQEVMFSSAVFNGKLYVGQGDDTAGDGDILFYDGTSWATAYDGSQEVIRALAVFNGKLYAAQGNSTGDGDIFICDPTKAGAVNDCDNASDWSTAYDGAQEFFASLAVYNGKLYAGQGNGSGDGDVYVCTPATAGNANDCDNASDWAVSYNSGLFTAPSLAVFNGKLYAGQGNVNAGDGDIVYYDGSSWTAALAGAQEDITGLTVYNGKLYAGQGVGTGDGDVLVCNPVAAGDVNTCDNASDWTTSYNGAQEQIVTMSVYNGKLYAGQGNGSGDGDILMYDGSTWTTSYDGAKAIMRVFAPYNSKLYAGQGSTTGDGDVYVYTEARTASYPLKFTAGSGRLQKVGNIWFEDEDSYGTAGGPGADVGVFKMSHALITNAGLFDIAEDYPTQDKTLGPGDVVSLSPTGDGSVVLANAASAVGVVSTKPGYRLSGPSAAGLPAVATVPVALAGRVPVKIDPSSDPIVVGDALTVGTLPGTARKATTTSYILGKAIENWSPSQPTAEMTVQPGLYMGPLSDSGELQELKVNDLSVNNVTIQQYTNGSELNRGKVVIGAGESFVRVNRSWDKAPTAIIANTSADTYVYATNLDTHGVTLKLGSPSTTNETIYWTALW